MVGVASLSPLNYRDRQSQLTHLFPSESSTSAPAPASGPCERDPVLSILSIPNPCSHPRSDVADQFPSAEVTGIDISPIQPAWVPPNLRFEIDDAQLPWTYPPDHFDFVHIRNLHGAISDWPSLYREAFRCTQPGGYLEHVEFNIRTLSDIAPEDHIYFRWNALFAEAGERMGRTFQIYDQMRGHIADAGYVDVVTHMWKVPIGGWAKNPRLKNVGLYTLMFLDQSVEGFALYMLKNVMGWEFVEIQVLIAQIREAWRQWRRWQPYYEM